MTRANRPARKTSGPRQDHPIDFFLGFLKRPKQVGSVIPSSRFLEKRIVKSADLAHAKLAVELGPGTGGTTRAFLRQMAPDAKLLAIEINPDFVRLLRRKIHDPRLIVHEGSAAEISAALREHGLDAPDVILSGIPFSTMGRELGMAILRSVYDSLSPDGRFVAYQFRDRVETLGREVFGDARVQTEVLNVPPMRVYRWDKRPFSRTDLSHRA
ncbi:MAG: class I SAM-dependent methyltransferase [Myxococcota bacterium]